MKETFMSNVVIPFSPSTVVMNSQVEKFATQYRLCVQKTAIAILELAKVVGDAKRELSKELFVEFREAIGANASKDTYIKKLLCIAKASARFTSISDRLPPSYTTLYSLSQMKDDVFKKISTDDVISPEMTARTLVNYLKMKRVVVSAKKIRQNNQCVTFILDLKNIEKNTAVNVLKEIEKVCKSFFITYECSIDNSSSFQFLSPQDLIYEEKIAA
jgi:hypothetical protein